MTQNNSSISLWLGLCCLMVIFMISLGGFVRLTNSGLSIVEWKPVTGIVPPLNLLAWEQEFSKYQASPEYIKHNYNMGLSEFKSIYWLEYLHRIAGRILAIIYLIPLLYFFFKKKIEEYSYRYFFIAFLLFSQGLMGWLMVKSGLIDKPSVSHYRLAAHLLLAIIMYILLFWQLMLMRFDILLTPKLLRLNPIKKLLILAVLTIITQIFMGGLVAGLDAGLIYNTFPLMGGSFIPAEAIKYPASFIDFSEPVFVQFTHRMLAYFLSLLTIVISIKLYYTNQPKLQKLAIYVNLALLAQMLLGISTLLFSVPLMLALTHQLGAVLLLSLFLWGLFLTCTN